MTNAPYICPPPSALSPRDIINLLDLYASIKNLDQSIQTPDASFGGELRLSYQMTESEVFNNQLKPDNPIWEIKCRKLFMRPAVEPIIFSYWSAFTDLRIDDESACDLTSALLGSQAQLAQTAMGTASKNTYQFFEPRNIASLWLTKILSWESDESLKLAWPIYSYAQIIMAHPFNDGNGRLARCFLQGALARVIGLRAPVLALAPTIYLSSRRLAAAFKVLSIFGRWDLFFEQIIPIIRGAVRNSDSSISRLTPHQTHKACN